MEAIPNATTVLQIVRNQLSLFTIYSDINDDLSFTHQYIRDYFASIFRLNAFCSMDFDDDNVYSNYLESNLSSETMELANEILIYSEHYQTPFVLDEALTSSDFSKHPLVLTNLLKQLSHYHEGDLSTYHFKNINFSKQHLIEHCFYNYEKKTAATFTNCTFDNESNCHASNYSSHLRQLFRRLIPTSPFYRLSYRRL